MSIAKYIDHTILKPDTSLADIDKLCEEAKHYGFATICIPPYFIAIYNSHTGATTQPCSSCLQKGRRKFKITDTSTGFDLNMFW